MDETRNSKWDAVMRNSTALRVGDVMAHHGGTAGFSEVGLVVNLV